MRSIKGRIQRALRARPKIARAEKEVRDAAERDSIEEASDGKRERRRRDVQILRQTSEDSDDSCGRQEPETKQTLSEMKEESGSSCDLFFEACSKPANHLPEQHNRSGITNALQKSTLEPESTPAIVKLLEPSSSPLLSRKLREHQTEPMHHPMKEERRTNELKELLFRVNGRIRSVSYSQVQAYSEANVVEPDITMKLDHFLASKSMDFRSPGSKAHLASQRGTKPIFEASTGMYTRLNADTEKAGAAGPLPFFDFLKMDIGLQTSTDDTRRSANRKMKDDVFNLIKIPFHIEATLMLGWFACLDAILFMLTFLPIRIVYSLVCLLPYFRKTRQHRKLIIYDLLRGVIISFAVLFLVKTPISQIYHFIRAQSFIKLYVMFNMLDIFERLFCTLGQDIMESLFYLSQSKFVFNKKTGVGISLRIFLAIVYSILHSYLYFTRFIVLNAAIDSNSKSLLSLLLSNNFIEIKSSVFKRFAEANLFQITCSDIVERFEITMFLFLIFLNLETITREYFFSNLIDSVFYIVFCELLVDWIKHMFIIRFNKLKYNVYIYYREILCRDLLKYLQVNPHSKSGKSAGTEKQTDLNLAVAQRIGLATTPLTCVLLRFLYFFLKDNQLLDYSTVALIFLNLCALKLLVSMLLRAYACFYVMYREHKIVSGIQKLQKEEVETKKTQKGRQPATGEQGDDTDPAESLEQHKKRVELLSKVKRYMLFSSRVPV